MAENMDEGQAKQPVNTTPQEVTSPKETKSITTNQSLQTMEVHHRAHTARKKWSHYFWEFHMLFLAVFYGASGKVLVGA